MIFAGYSAHIGQSDLFNADRCCTSVCKLLVDLSLRGQMRVQEMCPGGAAIYVERKRGKIVLS
jgi:hypothetical protein